MKAAHGIQAASDTPTNREAAFSEAQMLFFVACLSLSVAFTCAAIIAIDEVRRPQKMWIMNVVWPATAMYWSVFGLWGYFKFGRAGVQDSGPMKSNPHAKPRDPTRAQVAEAASHCGAGCTIADVIAEFGVAGFGITLFGSTLWTSYAIDFAAAWLLGIAFQYFTLKPMGHLTAGQALIAAVKADTLSILAFQVGMYAWMALVFFVLFPGPHLTPFQPQYWFMMQIAMILGFATAYPMNRWLIRRGIKEAMG